MAFVKLKEFVDKREIEWKITRDIRLQNDIFAADFFPRRIHLFNVQQWSCERDKMKIEVESLLFITKELCVLILTKWKNEKWRRTKSMEIISSFISNGRRRNKGWRRKTTTTQLNHYKFDAIRVELIKIVMFWWLETVFQFPCFFF